MPERDSSNGVERRGVLTALAAGLGGVGLARSSLARRVDVLDASQFVVEQGDRCIPITPLSGDETVEEFYDYRTPFTSPSGDAYSSYGTTDLQRPETSICFLYDGPQGLSLVVVHDELEDGTNGGAVTFQFDGLTGGSWIVRDDDYDAPSNYDHFTETAEGWQIDWTWAESRSDGGVYRPLGDDFAVTIDPAFNEAAELYGDPYEGAITDWQVLSGDRSDPERVSLALDQPITIRTGGCSGTTTTTQETMEEEESTGGEQETTEGEEETTTEEEENEDEQNDQQSSGPISAEVELEPQRVNPRSHGRLPVVVHSTADFDATAIESGSVGFGPEGGTKRASPVKRIRTDADGDGRTDLKLHFWMDDTGIDWSTDRVELTAETANGRAVVAETAIQLVSRDEDDEDESEGEKEEREDRDDHESEDDDDDEREEDDEDDEAEGEEENEDDDEDDDNHDEDYEETDNEDDDEDDDDEDDEDDESEERGRGAGRGNGRGNGGGQGKDHGDDEDD